MTFFLWAVFFVCFLGARSWTQELTHARCVLWDGPPSTFLFLDYRSPNAFLSLVFCKLSSAWETSPCASLLIGSSWQLGCRLHVTCLESLIVGLPSTVSSVILSNFLYIVYCCWRKSSDHLLFFFICCLFSSFRMQVQESGDSQFLDHWCISSVRKRHYLLSRALLSLRTVYVDEGLQCISLAHLIKLISSTAHKINPFLTDSLGPQVVMCSGQSFCNLPSVLIIGFPVLISLVWLNVPWT